MRGTARRFRAGKRTDSHETQQRRMERHGSCSAWDEDDMMADDMMAEALTRSASAAQREARESDPSQTSRKHSPQPPAPKRVCTVGVCGR